MLDFSLPGASMVGCFLAIVIIVAILLAVFMYFELPMVIFPVSVLAVIMVSVLCTFLIVSPKVEANTLKATHNLELKYDIKDVLWDDPRTTASYDSQHSNQQVVVVANNDQRYVFDYTMNLDTSEPTLTDPPIQGGATPDNATTAEILLKK